MSLFLSLGISLQITKPRVAHNKKVLRHWTVGVGTFVFSSFSHDSPTLICPFRANRNVCVSNGFPCGVVVPYTGCEDTGDNISSATGGGADDLIIQRRGNGRTGTRVVLNLSLYVIRCVALLARNKLVNYISYADVSLPLLSTFLRARTPCFFAV